MAKALAPAQHPSQIVSEIEARQELMGKMAELTEPEQDLITMRIFEKKDWKDIAEVLGCSRVTARERFDRTIANLARRVS